MFLAFPGILNWQRRIWMTIQSFRIARDDKLDPPPDLEEKELSLWDSRNFYVRGVTFNYIVSHQLSIAISKMQGLTNDLRVSVLVIILVINQINSFN